MKVHSAGHSSAGSIRSEREAGHAVQVDDVRAAEVGWRLSIGRASGEWALNHHDLNVVARRCVTMLATLGLSRICWGRTI